MYVFYFRCVVHLRFNYLGMYNCDFFFFFFLGSIVENFILIFIIVIFLTGLVFVVSPWFEMDAIILHHQSFYRCKLPPQITPPMLFVSYWERSILGFFFKKNFKLNASFSHLENVIFETGVSLLQWWATQRLSQMVDDIKCED